MTEANGRSKTASVSLGGKSLRSFARAAFWATGAGNAVAPIVAGSSANASGEKIAKLVLEKAEAAHGIADATLCRSGQAFQPQEDRVVSECPDWLDRKRTALFQQVLNFGGSHVLFRVA